MNITLFQQNNLDFQKPDFPSGEELHIWILPLSANGLRPEEEQLLSPSECAQAGKYRHETDRQRYLTGHIALRKILGNYYRVPPQSLSFTQNEKGKPALNLEALQAQIGSAAPCVPIYFNLSHSGEYVALAFATSPVGIDLEKIKESKQLPSLVKRFFHSEEAALFDTLPGDVQTFVFYRYWTIREAFLKGIGSGLSLSPASFYVEAGGSKPSLPEMKADAPFYTIRKGQKDYSSWRILPVPAPNGYLISVACCKATGPDKS